MRSSVAAARAAARLRGLAFYRPHKGTHKFSVNLRRNRIETLRRQKLAGLFDSIYSGGFDFNLLESGRPQFCPIFAFFQRTGDAARPEKQAFPEGGRQISARYHI